MSAAQGASVSLVAEGLQAGYGSGTSARVVVHDVTAAVHPGEIVCLLGVNGAGKSTLLRTLIGNQRALSGTVRLGNRDVARLGARERARRLAVLLTDRVDVPLLRSEEIVALGRSPYQGWLGATNARDRSVVEHAMALTGATPFVGRFITELSDGERQRVMLARALAQEPELLVLDEPLAFLDLVRRVELMGLLRQLADSGLAILLSIHDVEQALRTADTLWIIQKDGSFEAGAPEDLALNGRIAEAFGTAEVGFDHGSGTFVSSRAATSATGRINASGNASLWAARALERAGLVVVDGAANFELTAIERPGSQAWLLAAGHAKTPCDTLGDAVRAIRRISARDWAIACDISDLAAFSAVGYSRGGLE